MVPKPIVINGVFKGAPINGRKSMGNSLGLLYFTPIPVELFHSIYKLVGRGPPCTQKKNVTFSWAMEKKTGWLFDIESFVSTQWYGDYFISQYKDPVMNQPVFHGKLRYFLPKVFREKSRTASHMRLHRGWLPGKRKLNDLVALSHGLPLLENKGLEGGPTKQF